MIPFAGKSQRILRVSCIFLALIVFAFLPASEYEPAVTMALLGDVMLGRGVARAHAGGQWQNTLQSLTPILQSADLALANLESPLACEGTVSAGNRVLIAPPESVAVLTSAGLDILSTANNHARDAGEKGIRCTQNILAAHGLSDLDSDSILFEDIHGISLTFLAADLVSENSPGAINALADQVLRLHREGRIVVVSLHWGMEYQAGSDDLQQRIARRLADSGADILWGHHPHTVQEIEWIGDTLVLYSLGNALFDQIAPSTAQWGEVVWVEVDRRGARLWTSIRFNLDIRQGRTGSWRLWTFRFSPAPVTSGR